MIAQVQAQARELGALYSGSLPRGFFTQGYAGGRWVRVIERSDVPEWPTTWRAWWMCYGASFWPERTS